MARLADIAHELYRNARRSGQDRHADLPKGARLAARVENLGDGQEQMTLTIARKGARVGTSEELTFIRQCGIPSTAQRWPESGQREQVRDGEKWFLVGFRWTQPIPKENA